MAIACLRFFTGCFPERMWCISVRTSFCALRPYFRPRERERDVERRDPERLDDERRDERCDEDRLERADERCPRERRRLEELRLLAMLTSRLSDACDRERVGVPKRAYSFRINTAGGESKR
jgi:hypothetical protein